MELLATMDFHVSNTFDWLNLLLDKFMLHWFVGLKIDRKNIEMSYIFKKHYFAQNAFFKDIET